MAFTGWSSFFVFRGIDIILLLYHTILTVDLQTTRLSITCRILSFIFFVKISCAGIVSDNIL
ncbi:hypothetical protein L228DRAFT_14284 [Xylona heveae TC161]|uniref:Uncharacterized protein n=1 Tax=Xylona heveae (strain CBS 132557 / TC161) TaxID=1328760 RepID=A0A165JQG4_XYLHT|nr:hypothetical protein L228DRAFT_14284 [Xylona heveae TC161]KZF26512.1 hypothetical protein L228DRAFT_14284 [Xylona heveae TC161]